MAHKPGQIILIFATILVFCATLVFNYLASGAAGRGLFLNATGDVSNYYFLEITPPGWVFSIWGFIYAWQILWLLYGVTTICRKTELGYLYTTPGFMSASLYVTFILNLLANIAWIFLWDRMLPEYSMIAIIVMALTLYMCLFISYRGLSINGAAFTQQGHAKDLWMVRGFVQNGLAFYAMWVTIANLLNLAVVLTYISGMTQYVASSIALSLLLVIILTYFFLDVTVWDKYVRYTVSPYIVQIVALAGAMTKNLDLIGEWINPTFTAFILAVSCLAFVIKILTMFIRHKKNPIFSKQGLSLFKTNYGTTDSTTYEKL